MEILHNVGSTYLTRSGLGSLIIAASFSVLAPIAYRAWGKWLLAASWLLALLLAAIFGSRSGLELVAMITIAPFPVTLLRQRERARVGISVFAALIMLAVVVAVLLYLLNTCEHGCI